MDEFFRKLQAAGFRVLKSEIRDSENWPEGSLMAELSVEHPAIKSTAEASHRQDDLRQIVTEYARRLRPELLRLQREKALLLGNEIYQHVFWNASALKRFQIVVMHDVAGKIM